MGHLDARDALASTPESTVSDRKSQSRRWTRATSHERSGRLLHDIFPSAVVGLFRFRFRTWIFVLLVHEGFRIIARGCVGAATDRRAKLRAGDFRRDLGTIFQLRAMVVFVARYASRNDHHLGDLPGNAQCVFSKIDIAENWGWRWQVSFFAAPILCFVFIRLTKFRSRF